MNEIDEVIYIIHISGRLFDFTGGYETKSVFHNGQYITGMPDGEEGGQGNQNTTRNDDYMSTRPGQGKENFGKLQQRDQGRGIMQKFK